MEQARELTSQMSDGTRCHWTEGSSKESLEHRMGWNLGLWNPEQSVWNPYPEDDAEPMPPGPSHHKLRLHRFVSGSGGDVEADLAAERYSVTTWMDIRYCASLPRRGPTRRGRRWSWRPSRSRGSWLLQRDDSQRWVPLGFVYQLTFDTVLMAPSSCFEVAVK